MKKRSPFCFRFETVNDTQRCVLLQLSIELVRVVVVAKWFIVYNVWAYIYIRCMARIVCSLSTVLHLSLRLTTTYMMCTTCIVHLCCILLLKLYTLCVWIKLLLRFFLSAVFVHTRFFRYNYINMIEYCLMILHLKKIFCCISICIAKSFL